MPPARHCCASIARILSACVLLLAATPAGAQRIFTIAGNGQFQTTGDGGPATSAGVTIPSGVAHDAQGNIYIAEPYAHRVRKVAPNGIIATVAGTGSPDTPRGDGGPATSASLTPQNVAVDVAGNLYITDTRHQRIRKVTPAGTITTVAGSGYTGNFGDGGLAIKASFSNFNGLEVDRAGNIYVSSGNRVRKVTPTGYIYAFAGTGVWGYTGDGGKATSATFQTAAGIASDAAGNVYIADTGIPIEWGEPAVPNVRKVDSAGNISTLAGGGSFKTDFFARTMKVPSVDVAVDSAGYVYIVGSEIIHKVSPEGWIAKVVGDPPGGERFAGDGGLATLAHIYGAGAIDIDDSDNLLIADRNNNRVRLAERSGPIPQPQGTNALSPMVSYAVPKSAYDAAVGDFNGDGRNDVAVAVGGTYPAEADDMKVVLFLQQASGTLGPPVSTGLGSAYPAKAAVVVTDLNHDGRGDIVVAHALSYTVFLGNAAGTLTGNLTKFASDSSSAIALDTADFNLDGQADLVIAGTDENLQSGVWLFLGNGNGTFETPRFSRWACFNPQYMDLAVGDLNTDGFADVAGNCGGKTILINDQHGGLLPQWGRWTAVSSNPLHIADLNSDGRDDVFAVDGVFLQDATRRLEGPVGLGPTFPGPVHFVAGDLNGDGRVDLAGRSKTEPAVLGYFQGKPGGFLPMARYQAEDFANFRDSAITMGDVNSDGCKDVVSLSDSPKLLVFHGRCTPMPAIADQDGDHKSDLLWLESAGRVNAWPGADASQARSRAIPTGWNVVAEGDFNGDLRSELVLRHCRLGGNRLLGAGSTAGSMLASMPASWRVVASGDFNADGIADLLWQRRDGSTQLWPSADARRRRAGAKLASGWHVAATGDFDGDGRADVFWRHGPTGANLIWRAGGLLGSRRAPAVLDQRWRVIGSGDLDADGRSDVVWRQSISGVNSMWSGADSMRSKTLGTLADSAWALVSVGDFDADRHADLAWQNTRTGQTMLWKRGKEALQVALSGHQPWSRPLAAGQCPR